MSESGRLCSFNSSELAEFTRLGNGNSVLKVAVDDIPGDSRQELLAVIPEPDSGQQTSNPTQQ